MGRSLSVVTTARAGQAECKRLVSTDAIDWSVAMQMGGQVHAITQLVVGLWNSSDLLIWRKAEEGGLVYRPSPGNRRYKITAQDRRGHRHLTNEITRLFLFCCSASRPGSQSFV